MLLLDIRSVFGDYYVFQQDGAPAHRARDTVTMLQRETPEFIPPEMWPVGISWRYLMLMRNWLFCGLMLIGSFVNHRAKTDNARLSAHPTKKACWIGGKLWNRKHGFEKDPGLYALSRSLSHEVCHIRDCSAPVVPRQEEISDAATARLAKWKCQLMPMTRWWISKLNCVPEGTQTCAPQRNVCPILQWYGKWKFDPPSTFAAEATENREIYILHLYSMPPLAVTRSKFREDV